MVSCPGWMCWLVMVSASSSGLTAGGWLAWRRRSVTSLRPAGCGTWWAPSTARRPGPAAWRTRWRAPHRRARGRGGCPGPAWVPPRSALGLRRLDPIAARWRRAVVPVVGGPRSAHRHSPPPWPPQRDQLPDGLVDHCGSPAVGGALSVASCSNSAESLSWPSITLRAFSSSLARRWFSRRSRVLSRSTGSAGGVPAGRPALPDRAACATQRSARCPGLAAQQGALAGLVASRIAPWPRPLGTSGSGRCWLSIPSACTPDITVLLMVVPPGDLPPRPLDSMIRCYHLPHQRLTQRGQVKFQAPGRGQLGQTQPRPHTTA
jgi:hypothetical protein